MRRSNVEFEIIHLYFLFSPWTVYSIYRFNVKEDIHEYFLIQYQDTLLNKKTMSVKTV